MPRTDLKNIDILLIAGVFADGMVALARYFELEVLHAHTKAPDMGDKDWYSGDCADGMLIARKPCGGNAKFIDRKIYMHTIKT